MPPAGFMKKVRALLDRHDILMIADEVITGFGRTGEWFGARLDGFAPDIMCIAKAITSGYFPLGACMVNEKIEQAFMTSDDALASIYHGYTYSGHPVGCAAALACLDETFSRDLPGNSAREGGFILDALHKLTGKHDTIGDVRGKGLMLAVEFVSDRKAKTPAGKTYMAALADAAYDAGALVRVSGNNMIMSPPLVLERKDSQAIVDAINHALTSVKLDPAK